MTARTLKHLERAAMRWHRYKQKNNGAYNFYHLLAIELACTAHESAQRKGAKRKGRR